VRKALQLALENMNGLAVLGGAAWLYVGIRGFSPHAADVVAGGLVLLIGVCPYLLRLRKKRP
jgi:hypothetical protein